MPFTFERERSIDIDLVRFIYSRERANFKKQQ